MTVEKSLRLIGGALALASLALGTRLIPCWYLFAPFVGLNLFQSGFTNRCPIMAMLRKRGVRDSPEVIRYPGRRYPGWRYQGRRYRSRLLDQRVLCGRDQYDTACTQIFFLRIRLCASSP